MSKIITPLANRGLNSQDVHGDTKSFDQRFQIGIDWLQGTIPIACEVDVLNFLDLIQPAVKDAFVLHLGVQSQHGKVWSNFARGAEGSLVTWNLPGEMNDKGTLWFSFSASVLARVGCTRQICKFVKMLVVQFSAKFTRIDIAIDDYEKKLDYNLIKTAIDNKNFTGFRKGSGNWSDDGGWTIYLGSSHSQTRTRIYNKEIESKGNIDAIRFERVFKDAYAVELGKVIASLDVSQNDWCIGFTLARCAVGGINFLVKSSKNLERCETLYWWHDFVSSFLEPIKLRVERIKPTLERSKEWFRKSVLPSLAMLKKVFGKSFIDESISQGEERLGSRHYAIMNSYEMGKKIIYAS